MRLAEDAQKEEAIREVTKSCAVVHRHTNLLKALLEMEISNGTIHLLEEGLLVLQSRI
jgi:hypothetical protein